MLMGRAQAALLTAVVLAIAAGAAALVLFTTDEERREDGIAQFVPADAELYVTLNLDPNHPQSALRDEFLSRSGFGGAVGQAIDLAEDEFGLSYADDVEPWLGGEIAFVGLPGFLQRAQWYAIAQVADPRAAGDFLDVVAALEDLFGRIEADSYRDADILLFEHDGPALGLTDEFMLLASNRNTLIGALRDLERPPAATLAGDAVYREARAAMAEDGFTFAFWRPGETLADALEFTGMEVLDIEYLAVSAAFIDNGLRVNIAVPTPGLEDLGSANNLRSLDLLPADTVAAVSFTGVPEAWDVLSESLGQAGMLDAFSDIERGLGFDIERDVIDSLAGEVAFALLPSDVRFEFGHGLQGAFNVLLLAELSDDSRFERALDGLFDLLQGFGLPAMRESVGGRDVAFVMLDSLDSDLEGYALGYFIDDGMLVAGSTSESIEEVGAGDSLQDSAKFRRVREHLPKGAEGLVYLDIEGAVSMAEDALDASFGDYLPGSGPLWVDLYRTAGDALAPFGAFFAASHLDEDGISRTILVLTLRE